jgi:hypothetical protein
MMSTRALKTYPAVDCSNLCLILRQLVPVELAEGEVVDLKKYKIARPERFELPASWFVASRSAAISLVGRLLQYKNRARRGTTKDDRLTKKSRDPISETPRGRDGSACLRTALDLRWSKEDSNFNF